MISLYIILHFTLAGGKHEQNLRVVTITLIAKEGNEAWNRVNHHYGSIVVHYWTYYYICSAQPDASRIQQWESPLSNMDTKKVDNAVWRSTL